MRSDLYFVDEALRSIGEGSRGLRARTRAARLAVFDSLPDPRGHPLFTGVESEHLGRRVRLWRKVPAGSFWMGSPEGEGDDDEWPQHEVTLSGFWIASVPVTHAQYAFFAEDRHESHWSKGGLGEDDLGSSPVTDVSWWSAMAYCRWLAARLCRKDRLGGRLPTEAEWEYACRGHRNASRKKHTRWWTGSRESSLKSAAWYGEDFRDGKIHPVAELRANGLGLFDVHGNVGEWCYDGLREYGNESQQDPMGPLGPGAVRVVRGGCYWYDADSCRSACRGGDHPGDRDQDWGFRAVLPAPPALRIDG